MAFNAVRISQAFDASTDLAKTIYGRVLLPNDQDRHNWFSDKGMVTRTNMEGMVDTPIHMVLDYEQLRGDTLRVFLGGIMRGTPTIGARTPAGEDAKTIPQSKFDFKVIDMYGDSLEIPHAEGENRVSVSIFANYLMNLRSYWGGVVENTILIYATGMRGLGDNWAQLDITQTGTAANISSSNAASMTEYMKKMNERNPITAPRRQFAAWHTAIKQGTALSPGSAIAVPASGTNTNALDFSLINEMMTYLSGISVDRYGVSVEKPSVRVGENMGSQRKEWPWLITPEIAREIRQQVGSSGVVEWQNYQSSRVEGGLVNSSGFDNAMIGRIYGMSFLEMDKLPRYKGGSSGDVPIARTLVLCRQSVVYGYRNKQLPDQWLGRFHNMTKRGRFYGSAFRCWIESLNRGRLSSLESEMTFGCAKLSWNVPEDQSVTVDKGVIAMDVPYRDIHGQNDLL